MGVIFLKFNWLEKKLLIIHMSENKPSHDPIGLFWFIIFAILNGAVANVVVSHITPLWYNNQLDI